jgi:hypothetical protein
MVAHLGCHRRHALYPAREDQEPVSDPPQLGVDLREPDGYPWLPPAVPAAHAGTLSLSHVVFPGGHVASAPE